MKIDFDNMRGGLSVESTHNHTILRHLYKYGFAIHRCLIRIYELEKATIVIASQLNCPPLIWDDGIISHVIHDFQLDTKNLFWIVHVGLFSNFKPPKEEFLLTFFSEKEESILQRKKYNIIETINIDLKQVEKLIKRSLEPVETWLGLDLQIQKKKQQDYQKNQQNLLNRYLKNNLDFLFEQNKVKELLPKALIGAFFFYPEQREKKSDCVKFIGCAELEKSDDKCEQLAFSYLSKYLPDKEIVICVRTEKSHCYCSIVSKKSLLMA